MYDTQWLSKCLSCTSVVTREKKKPSHMSHDLVPHKLSQRSLARQQCVSQLQTQKSSWKVSPQLKREGTVRRSKQREKGGACAFKPLPPSCFFLLLLHFLCRDYIFPLSINFKCILFSAASAGSSPCAACACTHTQTHTHTVPSFSTSFNQFAACSSFTGSQVSSILCYFLQTIAVTLNNYIHDKTLTGQENFS